VQPSYLFLGRNRTITPRRKIPIIAGLVKNEREEMRVFEWKCRRAASRLDITYSDTVFGEAVHPVVDAAQRNRQ
jgi:hypothetical protein